MTRLMMRIQDASVTEFDNFLDTSIGRPVQVPLVFTEFDKGHRRYRVPSAVDRGNDSRLRPLRPVSAIVNFARGITWDGGSKLVGVKCDETPF
ncbi:hypothetical protein OUZ56_006195 [Daphnia magna]|uniref:Uncharacterized protein n=1 Tax=Daphnia magna TaxID=35525 RepID=A0ABQ9YUX7_9CRUS|nr:hypothetical protein OUZ56_006195 [Daphnia magna]